MTICRNEEIRVGAESMKQLYDEYILAGFNDIQALELCKSLIAGGVKRE